MMRVFKHLALTGLAVATLNQPVFAQAVDVAALLGSADIARGQTLYKDSCASCHGADLEGQESWQTPKVDGQMPAPPHDRTGHTWHHGDGDLFDYTKLGGAEFLKSKGVANFNSGMPGFAETLGDQDIADVLAFIKSTWPDREREIQAGRTRP